MLNMLLWAVVLAGLPDVANVRERDGNIFFVGVGGVSRQLTFIHADKSPIISSDGRKVVYLRAKPKKAGGDVEQENEIWLSDISGKYAQRLLDVRPQDDVEKNLSQFNSLAFSTDGKLLYFLSAAWATSNALHVLDLKTGKEHFVTDADDVLVVGKGRYAGHLVVQKHKYFEQGGSYDCYWLVTAEGKEIKLVGDTKKQAERFVRSQ